jgi:polysaccharide export outer membrane protein
VTSGLEISRSGVQVVTIDREGHRYHMTVEHVFSEGSPDYYLTGGDTVRLEQFNYSDDRAYILGGGATPESLVITPEARPTLADILFVEGGPFATKTARNKEIYLLRGIEPMKAYHLDAGDPSRIMIAAELELRPNDIVFLTSKPIYELGELVSSLNPLALIASAANN